MILYFTGTGNSLYVAKKISEEMDEELISIKDLMDKELFTLRLQENEALGFVFPVYYYGIPTIVAEFIEKLVVKGYKNNYVFSLITCGGGIAAAGDMLKSCLKDKGISLSFVEPLVMPDNYILMYDLPSKEKTEAILNKAEKRLKEIIERLILREESVYPAPVIKKILTKAAYYFYKNGRSTKKFYADDKCISCGRCQELCPVKAIELVDGKPQWIKAQCVQCLACIHLCPRGAIQYGGGTASRKRYAQNYSDRFQV